MNIFEVIGGSHSWKSVFELSTRCCDILSHGLNPEMILVVRTVKASKSNTSLTRDVMFMLGQVRWGLSSVEAEDWIYLMRPAYRCCGFYYPVGRRICASDPILPSGPVDRWRGSYYPMGQPEVIYCGSYFQWECHGIPQYYPIGLGLGAVDPTAHGADKCVFHGMYSIRDWKL